MENKEHIEAIINRTFEVIQKVYKNQREIEPSSNEFIGSHIIFPQKREEDVKNQQEITRVSEQELKTNLYRTIKFRNLQRKLERILFC